MNFTIFYNFETLDFGWAKFLAFREIVRFSGNTDNFQYYESFFRSRYNLEEFLNLD